MRKIKATIERSSDGYYSIYCDSEMFTGAGANAEKAKEEMQKQMDFYKETAIAENMKYPSFLDEPYEIICRFDVSSFLSYYSGILSLTGLEKVTGIHKKQLWKYLHGTAKPRPKQIERIMEGLHSLGKELQSVKF